MISDFVKALDPYAALERNSPFHSTTIAIVAILFCMAGCSDGRYEVTGKVLRNGQPIELPDCRITFLQPNKGIFAANTLKSDGTYRVLTHKDSGLLPGSYQIVVSFPPEWPPPTKSSTEPFPPAELERRIGRYIPKKYRDPKTSGLELVITNDDVVFDVDMVE